MSYQPSANGRYTRIKDGAEVEVTSCTGSNGMATVTVQSAHRRSYVRLENFWRKYEAINCARCGSIPPAGICCSSHNIPLCHGCYRRTHFADLCVADCGLCAAEGLDPGRRMPEKTVAQ